MKKALIALALVAGCGGDGEQPTNEAATGGAGGETAAPQGAAPKAAGTSAAAAGLTGLYEGGSREQPNQLCIVERGGGEARFGIIVWGGNLHSCSGEGSAVREGNGLTLRMAGDESCEIAATFDGSAVTLPQSLPAGCNYYCGARASFGGVTLNRTGATAADAGRAKDLAGDPLCTAGD